MTAISAHDVDLVHLVLQTPSDDVRRVESAADAAKEGSSLVMDGIHHAGRQIDHVFIPRFQRRGEAAEAVHHAVHARDAVETIEGDRDFADDVVQTGADSAASDDHRAHLVLVEEDVLPGPCANVGSELRVRIYVSGWTANSTLRHQQIGDHAALFVLVLVISAGEEGFVRSHFARHSDVFPHVVDVFSVFGLLHSARNANKADGVLQTSFYDFRVTEVRDRSL